MNRILIYYDSKTGEILVIRHYGSEFPIPDDEQEQDYADYPELRNGEGIGRLFRHLTPQEQAGRWSKVRVDMTKQPHEIVFEEGI
ncbi:MAG: hypothetical protein ACOX8S_01835 [Christensenellales bacterium]|jgi:hypothetical protein